jgi:hypothetical protein
MVTARGRPSGTATTTIVTPKMKKVSGPCTIWDTGKPLFTISHLRRRTCKGGYQRPGCAL